MSGKPTSRKSSQQASFKIVRAIAYGNSATQLQNIKETPGCKPHTHQWTFYVKPYNDDQGLSDFIGRVEIRLHDTFKDPIRVFEEPPYEVTETGWGEFDILVVMYFKCEETKPVAFTHRLQLFPRSEEEKLKKEVEVDCYVEVNFPNPSEAMREALKKSSCREIVERKEIVPRFQNFADICRNNTIMMLQTEKGII